jgi:Protein of unknown function (DUF3618)
MTTTPTDPLRLRAEIARTRAELGATAEALAAKADVKARAKESAQHVMTGVKAQVGEPVSIGLMVTAATALVLAVVFWRRRR